MNENDDLKLQSTGVKFILEPGYNYDDLEKFIQDSCLAEKCLEMPAASASAEDLCKYFLNLLNDDNLTLDDITTLYVAVSMIYYIKATPENTEWRSRLLQKTFNYADTLSPMHLHIATKRMWNGLKLDGIDSVLNILSICQQISIASETGRAIGICLVWTILCEITETPIEMYCFREFSELIKMLKGIDDETLQMEDSIQIVYILVKVVGFLINVIVFDQNDDLKKAGYRNCFTYTQRDLQKLNKWSEHLCTTLGEGKASKPNKFWDLRMAIKEYIESSITTILQDKIPHKILS